MIAEVAFPIPLHQTFSYYIPPAMQAVVSPGMRVKASFGPRQLTGVVVKVRWKLESDAQRKIKNLHSVVDSSPFYNRELMELSEWMSRKWGSPIGEVISAFFPPALSSGRIFSPDVSSDSAGGFAPAEEKLNSSSIAGLPVVLTPGQEEAVAEVKSIIHSGECGSVLVFGASATGKTEIYIRAIKEAVACSRQALFLLPDIAIIEQFLREILMNFSGDIVAVWHSRIGMAGRMKLWPEIASGRKRIILGVRSACMLAFKDLALAVVDEEQDESYKQEDSIPHYHARDVVLWRAQRHNCAVILGSAAPSLETYHGAINGRHKLLRLPEKVSQIKDSAEIVVVDRKKYPGCVFSPVMAEKLKKAVENKGQAIVIMNRRGYAGPLVCLSCGWTAVCPDCESALIVHNEVSAGDLLLCHRCSQKFPLVPACPSCNNRIFRRSSGGTQKAEHEIRVLMQDCKIIRLDGDSSRKVSGEGRAAYKKFSSLEAQVLIGTRFVSRGYHFPNVTFAGVVDADTEMRSFDFRGAEKTFQMISQAAGRVARAHRPGEVVVQTYFPENEVFSCLREGGYEAFAERELAMRRKFGYPPFGSLLRCVVSAKKESGARQAADEISAGLSEAKETMGLTPPGNFSILGPVPCPLKKISGSYRYHFLVKSASENNIILCAQRLRKSDIAKTAKIRVFIDPFNFR